MHWENLKKTFQNLLLRFNIYLFLNLDIYLDFKKSICNFLIMKLIGTQCI